MTEHKDKFKISGSDSNAFRKNHPDIFSKKFKWIHIEIHRDGTIKLADDCQITKHSVEMSAIGGNGLDILCKDCPNGKCAYCGDAKVVSNTKRAIKCFYPVVQRPGSWHPKIEKKQE